MKWLAPLLLTLPLMMTSAAVISQSREYEGIWHTTNRKLDGMMTCVVTPKGQEQWQGRFFGVWQGVSFDYTVLFVGPAYDLHGWATIDGADYAWAGALGEKTGSFRGTFTGSRYNGYFDLQRKSRWAPMGNK